ncbi:MAG: helix-turn-helix domain-containing protein [Lachnospiraceae bacterium]|nr:helix-turn-helix domain-containing protein [Lachnospiraceae bacterium]
MSAKINIFDKTSIIVRKIRSDKNSSTEHRIHTNDGHELYLLLQGDVSFSIDGCIYKLVPGDMLMISNKEIHKTIVNKEIPHERIYIYFDPDFMSQFDISSYDLLQMFENRRLGFGNKISADLVQENKVYCYFEEIYRWYQSDSPERQIMMVSILLQLLVKVNTICSKNDGEDIRIQKNEGYNDKIYRIIRYISSNLDRKISLEELEKQFFINRYHLCHLFKNITGFTVIEYINYKKVLAAKEQLKKGKQIAEVWVFLGFEDYSSFYRSFKKIVGISPKEYLNNAAKGRRIE